MKLFSYIIARDYGFAPNPFNGLCTLATCKADIRKSAHIGDWIVGTGPKSQYNLAGHLIYAMKVDEILDYDTYWSDVRFQCKRPMLNGSLKQVYGDNIYHRDGRRWAQADSHHSRANGRRNLLNLKSDIRSNRVLLAQKFVYYGSEALLIPKSLREFKRTNEDICCPGRGYRVKTGALVKSFERWLEKSNKWGLCGLPIEFNGHARK